MFNLEKRDKPKFVNKIQLEYAKIKVNLCDIFTSNISCEEKVKKIQKIYHDSRYYNNYDREASLIPIHEFLNYLETTYEIDCSGIDNLFSRFIDYKSLKELERIPDALQCLYAMKFVFSDETLHQLLETNDPLLDHVRLQNRNFRSQTGTLLAYMMVANKQEQFTQLLQSIKLDFHIEYEICSAIWSIIRWELSDKMTYINRTMDWLESFPKYKDSFNYQIRDYLLEHSVFECKPNDLFAIIKFKNNSLLNYYINTYEHDMKQQMKEINEKFDMSKFLYCKDEDKSDEHFAKCIKCIDLICNKGLNEISVCELINKICQHSDWKKILLDHKGIYTFMENNKDFVLNYHYDNYRRSFKILDKIKSIF